ncbi:MAG: ATP-binding protein [Candidatus Heimdallarchaeota archaeon]
MKVEPDTYFAPAGRKNLEEIRGEVKEFFKTYFEELLNSIPNMALIVNKERQVVFLNQSIIQSLGIKNIEEAMGARPGEIFKCIHAQDFIHGCGTSRDCRYCGAVNAVLQSLKTNKTTSLETRITSKFDGNLVSFDLNVTTHPFSLREKKFVIVFLTDISNQKRRELLERTFLHDLLNMLTVVSGLIEIFPLEGLNYQQKEYFSKIKKTSKLLIEESSAQRDLLAAEKNELVIKLNHHNSLEIIESVVQIINYKRSAEEKEVRIDNNSSLIIFQTDSRLLSRILLNLLENALEASNPGETVEIGSYISNQTITFWIKNSTVMTDRVQSQVFQRSFSTKGPGRGIGTYSVKLLTERYLGGKVTFKSSKEEGTTFYVNLPINKK